MHLPSSSDREREIATLEDEASRAFVNRDFERRVTNVWRREGNRWCLYIRHANLIADATSPSSNSRQPAT